jgi:hypothetical protein
MKPHPAAASGGVFL